MNMRSDLVILEGRRMQSFRNIEDKDGSVRYCMESHNEVTNMFLSCKWLAYVDDGRDNKQRLETNCMPANTKPQIQATQTSQRITQ